MCPFGIPAIWCGINCQSITGIQIAEILPLAGIVHRYRLRNCRCSRRRRSHRRRCRRIPHFTGNNVLCAPVGLVSRRLSSRTAGLSSPAQAGKTLVVEISIIAWSGKSTELHRSNHPITLNVSVTGCLLARGKCITTAKIVEVGYIVGVNGPMPLKLRGDGTPAFCARHCESCCPLQNVSFIAFMPPFRGSVDQARQAFR